MDEVAELKSIRNLLVNALALATGTNREEVEAGPMAVANKHVANIVNLHTRLQQVLLRAEAAEAHIDDLKHIIESAE